MILIKQSFLKIHFLYLLKFRTNTSGNILHSIKLKNKFIALLFSSLLPFFFKAQTIYIAEVTGQPQRISNKFCYLIDESNQLNFSEVLKSKDFQILKDEVPNFNITSATIWGKILLTPKDDG